MNIPNAIFSLLYYTETFKIKNELVLSSAAHILKLELYREDQHGP